MQIGCQPQVGVVCSRLFGRVMPGVEGTAPASSQVDGTASTPGHTARRVAGKHMQCTVLAYALCHHHKTRVVAMAVPLVSVATLEACCSSRWLLWRKRFDRVWPNCGQVVAGRSVQARRAMGSRDAGPLLAYVQLVRRLALCRWQGQVATVPHVPAWLGPQTAALVVRRTSGSLDTPGQHLESAQVTLHHRRPVGKQ